MIPFISGNILSLKSNLSDINVVTPAFFFYLAWYIFFYPFTFNLFVYSYLKLFLIGSMWMGLVFLIQSYNFYLLIGMFRSFMVNVIIDNSLNLPFCYFLFVVMFMNVLFPFSFSFSVSKF